MRSFRGTGSSCVVGAAILVIVAGCAESTEKVAADQAAWDTAGSGGASAASGGAGGASTGSGGAGGASSTGAGGASGGATFNCNCSGTTTSAPPPTSTAVVAPPPLGGGVPNRWAAADWRSTSGWRHPVPRGRSLPGILRVPGDYRWRALLCRKSLRAAILPEYLVLTRVLAALSDVQRLGRAWQAHR